MKFGIYVLHVRTSSCILSHASFTLQHQPHPPHCHFPIIPHPPIPLTHILHIQTHSSKDGIDKAFDDESEFNHELCISSTHTLHQHQVRRIRGMKSFEKDSAGTLSSRNLVSSLEAHRTLIDQPQPNLYKVRDFFLSALYVCILCMYVRTYVHVCNV